MPGYTIFVAHPSRFVTDHRPSGDGLVAWEFLKRLAERGHRLHVACQRVDLAQPPPENVHFHSLSERWDLGLLPRLQYMARLRRLYRSVSAAERVDIVHQLNPVDLGVSLGLPSRARPLVLGPFVPSWPLGDETRAARADTVRTTAGARARRAIRTLQLRRAALVLVSTAAAAEGLPRPPRGTRVETLSAGIDPDAFALAPSARDGRPPSILFLANLQIRKGILTLVDAFERVHAAAPQARLLIAGSGSAEALVRERVAASTAAAAVEFLGRVPREDIAATLSRADVYCLPSFGEPFGMSALEAMAAGLPLVTTDAGGLRYLAPAAGALKVPPGDAAALADALLRTLADPQRRREMGRVNRETVQERYAWPRVIDRLETLYGEILAASR